MTDRIPHTRHLPSLTTFTVALPTLLLLCLTVVGCRSSGPKAPPSNSLTSIVIEDASLEAIRKATLDVFQQDFFIVLNEGTNFQAFEKRGSKMNDLAYGGWFGESTHIRAKITTTTFRERKTLVECDVFVVRNKGDSFFEDTSKVYFRKKSWKKMLKRIRNRVE